MRCKAVRNCLVCRQEFPLKARHRETAKYCSVDCFRVTQPVQMTTVLCEWCGEKVTKRKSRNPRFCGRSCAHKWKWAQPEFRERARLSMKQAVSSERRAALSASLKANPLTANPATREKISKALQGRTFLARGGNGQPTVPQKLLANALGWEMEHAICTAPVKGMFPSLPHCYKVDIADSTVKLAIEVDGRSHRSPRWRYLDNRKEEILRALGWKVLRFDNKRVLDDLHGVVVEVSTLLTSLQN